MLYIVPFLLPHWPVSALEEYSKCCAVCWKWHCRWNSVCNCECSARVCVCVEDSWKFFRWLFLNRMRRSRRSCRQCSTSASVMFIPSLLRFCSSFPIFLNDLFSSQTSKCRHIFVFNATVFFKFLSCTALHATQCRQHGKPCYNNCCTVTTHVHSFIQHCLKSGLALPGHLADK